MWGRLSLGRPATLLAAYSTRMGESRWALHTHFYSYVSVAIMLDDEYGCIKSDDNVVSDDVSTV